MSLVPTFLQQCPIIGGGFTQSSFLSSTKVSVKFTISCCTVPSPMTHVNGNVDTTSTERSEIRLGLPSKGRMATDTLNLFNNCQLSVRHLNPRQYVGDIPQLENLEVWFQRPKDIVRKLVSGDLDIGIVGLDTVSEYGEVPKHGIFEDINSIEELAQMPHWTAEKPLRVATGFTHLSPKFLKENGIHHVSFSTADGALEAAPAMGIADVIVDLVSSGATLKENNMKEIEGGVLLRSQAVMVASKKSLLQRKGLLDITHEMLERFEAHIRALDQYTVVANMRGYNEKEIAERLLTLPLLSGLQGPTVSPVFGFTNYYAIVICVPKKLLYKSVQQLRAIGGSGVLVSPLTYIFDEETPRWRELLLKLEL
ncbi:unnamed protein product [Lactuca virosa]|uniref:ATP phosphoribosyltransferase n=1 Tax=Lactuca virosa TaxID=75947 RepID=A0AAU9PJY5_9ASTR|nr:unnamed protein product [Lactuca virosa]